MSHSLTRPNAEKTQARGRSPSRGWARYPNLQLRPHVPNKGRGRLQRQIRRAFMAGGNELTSSQVYDWCMLWPVDKREPSAASATETKNLTKSRDDGVRNDLPSPDNRSANGVSRLDQQKSPTPGPRVLAISVLSLTRSTPMTCVTSCGWRSSNTCQSINSRSSRPPRRASAH